jgi:hypothetical protein
MRAAHHKAPLDYTSNLEKGPQETILVHHKYGYFTRGQTIWNKEIFNPTQAEITVCAVTGIHTKRTYIFGIQ